MATKSLVWLLMIAAAFSLRLTARAEESQEVELEVRGMT